LNHHFLQLQRIFPLIVSSFQSTLIGHVKYTSLCGETPAPDIEMIAVMIIKAMIQGSL
jgi:hypothetical protein